MNSHYLILAIILFTTCSTPTFGELLRTLPVEITPLPYGWAGGQCGNFSQGIANTMVKCGADGRLIHVINTNAQGGNHSFLIYRPNPEQTFLIDGTYAQFNGTSRAKRLCGSEQGRTIYSALNRQGVIEVSGNIMETYMDALTHGKHPMTAKDLCMQGGSSSSPYVQEGSEFFEKFSKRNRLMALEPSADYASRYVRPRTTPHSEPIINYDKLCSNKPSPKGSAFRPNGIRPIVGGALAVVTVVGTTASAYENIKNAGIKANMEGAGPVKTFSRAVGGGAYETFRQFGGSTLMTVTDPFVLAYKVGKGQPIDNNWRGCTSPWRMLGLRAYNLMYGENNADLDKGYEPELFR